MKKLIIAIYFQIGVNIIGLPEIIKHNIQKSFIQKSFIHKSKFHS